MVCKVHRRVRGPLAWRYSPPKVDARPVRFLLVGALNTVVGYGVFALMHWVGFHYGIASTIATIVGVIFNFKSTGTLVFQSSDNTLIFRFVLVYAFVLCVNLLGLTLLERVGISPYIGALALILPLAVLAYTLNARYVFQTNEKAP